MFPHRRRCSPPVASHDFSHDGSSFTLKNTKPDSWTYLKNELRSYDAQFVAGLREELDSDLLFAGLFSAVTTAFLAESYQYLAPNENQEVVNILNSILVQISANQSTDSFAPAPVEESHVVDPRIFNILWFFALATSLFVALFCILMKQWLREYMRWTEAHGQDAIRIRQMRREALTEWSVKDKIIVILPSMLQISLILFLVGLIFFLLEIDRITAFSVTILVVLYSSSFIYSLLVPAFIEQSPYRTQFCLYLRNIVHIFREIFRMALGVFRDKSSLRSAFRSVASLKRHDWVYRDQLRSWSLAKEPNYDPLNTAFAWIRSQFPDERTYSSVLESLSGFNSLPFVIDAGRRLSSYKPHTLRDVLHYWTRVPEVGQGFDPDLIVHGLEAIYLTPRAPGEFPSLVPPVDVLPGLTEFIIYRQDYRLSDDQVTAFTRLFYELHSYQFDHLGLGSSLPKENDLAYRRILRYLLEPRSSWIKPPAEALDKILQYGSTLHRNLSLDGAVPLLAPRALPTAALVFQISLLSMDEYLDDARLCGSFKRMCWNAAQLFTLSNGVPAEWGQNLRREFPHRLLDFETRFSQFSIQLHPIIEHLRRSPYIQPEDSDQSSLTSKESVGSGSFVNSPV